MTISLFGYEHELEFKTDSYMLENGLAGYYERPSRKIVISPQEDIAGTKFHADMVRDTIIHELIHACADDTGVTYDQDENLVCWFSKVYTEIEGILPLLDLEVEKIVG